jgi:flagellar motor component MotA
MFNSIAIILGTISGFVSLLLSYMSMNLIVVVVVLLVFFTPVLIMVLAIISSSAYWEKKSNRAKMLAKFGRIFFWSAFITQAFWLVFAIITAKS